MASPVDEKTEPKKKEADSLPLKAPVAADDFSTWLLNVIYLNHAPDDAHQGYDVHAQRTWSLMKENGLSMQDAIERYLETYKEKFIDSNLQKQQQTYADKHRGKTFGEARTARIRSELTDRVNEEIPLLRATLGKQVKELGDIEHSIQGVRPKPEDIANAFIEKRTLPLMHPGTQYVWQSMRDEGRTLDEAIKAYKIQEMQRLAGAAGITPPQAIEDMKAREPEIEAKIRQEVRALQEIRSGVVQYENTKITPEETVAFMRERWEERKNQLPNPPEHYTRMLEEKIRGYEAHFDPQTACSRAAVDLIAQIDRDRGVPPQAIVDENHTGYQEKILSTDSWLRREIDLRQHGSMPPAEAAAYGLENDRGLSKMTKLDFYSWKHGDRYEIYRRSAIEDAMAKTYKEHRERELENERGAEARAEASKPSPAKTAPGSTALAAVETRQHDLAERVFTKFGKMLPSDAGIRSADDLVENLRDPAFRKKIESYGRFLPGEVKTALHNFNALEQQRLALIDAPHPDTALALNANDPFRLKVTGGTGDPVTAQTVTVGKALVAAAGTDGTLTLKQAAAALNRIPGAHTEGGPERLAAIEREMGAEPGQTFRANDPRLLAAAAAYANNTTVAGLPEEWTESFAAVSAGLTVPSPGTVPRDDRTLMAQFLNARDAATPSETATPAADNTLLSGTPKIPSNIG